MSASPHSPHMSRLMDRTPSHSLSSILKTQRLARLAAHVLPGEPMADVGTDHALLPIACVASGLVPRAIAADLRPEPLRFARAHRSRYGISDAYLEIRLGPGLEPVHAGEVKSVTIAGMGAATMQTILCAHPPQTLGVERIVLQPTQGEDMLRRFLALAPHLHVVEEFMLEEAGHFYTNHVIDVSKQACQAEESPDERALFLGGAYLDEPSPTFLDWCRNKHVHFERLVQGLEHAHDPERVKAKRDQASQRLRWLAEMIS